MKTRLIVFTFLVLGNSCVALLIPRTPLVQPGTLTNVAYSPPLFTSIHKSKAFILSPKRRELSVLRGTSDRGDIRLVDDTGKPVVPRVYPQRWTQLIYLSLLALLSDWICFSVAATPSVYENAFAHSAASLIDIFLFTNVVSCFAVTDVVARVGLQRSVQAAAVLMMLGCWLRSGLFFLTGTVVPYPLLVAGTILVGAAQPFFQCTPPLLSAMWFAPQERATSTAVALNFNQIGIATAFLVGGMMATTISGMESYFGLISVVCSLVTLGTLVQFENEPLIPPRKVNWRRSLPEKRNHHFLSLRNDSLPNGVSARRWLHLFVVSP